MSRARTERQRAFLCHSAQDSEFVLGVASHLKRQMDLFYFEANRPIDETIKGTIKKELDRCSVFLLFVGHQVTKWQRLEVKLLQKFNRGQVARPKISSDGKPANRTSGHQYEANGARGIITIRLLDRQKQPYEIPAGIRGLKAFHLIDPHMTPDESARNPALETDCSNYVLWVAVQIVHALEIPWRGSLDLPINPHLFDYEKDIIDFYMNKALLGDELFAVPSGPDNDSWRKELERRREMCRKLLEGCPAEWPTVERLLPADRPNPLDKKIVGRWRELESQVLAAALTTYHQNCGHGPWTKGGCMLHRGLCLNEAGPRELLHFPRDERLRVAIVASGGIAPGTNAVIDGIVQRHWMYAVAHRTTLDLYGLRNGFRAFDDLHHSTILLAAHRHGGGPEHLDPTTARHVSDGGCMLGTSRLHERALHHEDLLRDLKNIVDELHFLNIDILYVIGGDGSMKMAHALRSVAKENGRPLSVVGIPKTMDNDILWVWQSFGFLSAVEKGREVIEDLHTEVQSNPRLCVIQLFGSDSGFVVSHAVLASATDQCDAALIPEVPFSMRALAHHVQQRMLQRCQGGIPHGLIVMAETAIPEDALEYIHHRKIGLSPEEKSAVKSYCDLRDEERRLVGQTNDALRSGGLKIVSRGLPLLLQQSPVNGVTLPKAWRFLRVVTNEPRHLLRAIRPSCSDIITGQRLGTLAVDNAMAGYTDFMISQWLTEYVLVPLKLVVLGRKRIPREGIFWRTVLAKTGQPTDMVTIPEASSPKNADKATPSGEALRLVSPGRRRPPRYRFLVRRRPEPKQAASVRG